MGWDRPTPCEGRVALIWPNNPRGLTDMRESEPGTQHHERGSTMSTETIYHVDVIGHIWQPGVGPCAYSVTVHEPMEYGQADDETNADYLIRMVQCAADHYLGDFESIDAYQITAVDTTRAQTPDGFTETRIYRDLLVFDDDNADIYASAMFGGEE